MSRLIEDEFDELVLYVAGLKKNFGRKLDDHLFIIQQQNQRLDEQARLIDELAWQIRDLRASVRGVGDKLKVVQQQQTHRDQLIQNHQCKCDYANVLTNNRRRGSGSGQEEDGRISSNGIRRSGSLRRAPPVQPRITMVNEEVSDGVKIIQEDDYPEEDFASLHEYDDHDHHQQHRQSYGDDNEGLYEPIQFVERRDYTAPPSSNPPLSSASLPSSLNSATTTTTTKSVAATTTSLSARHRQTKQQQQKHQLLPPKLPERNGRSRRVDQFHFPPPPPFEALDEGESLQTTMTIALRPTKDYPLMMRRNRNGGSNGKELTSSLTEIVEETASEEHPANGGDSSFLRTEHRSAAEREANSLKRRAYILPDVREK